MTDTANPDRATISLKLAADWHRVADELAAKGYPNANTRALAEQYARRAERLAGRA